MAWQRRRNDLNINHCVGTGESRFELNSQRSKIEIVQSRSFRVWVGKYPTMQGGFGGVFSLRHVHMLLQTLGETRSVKAVRVRVRVTMTVTVTVRRLKFLAYSYR